MRYFWALLAYVASIVVAVSACSATGKVGSHATGGSVAQSTASTGSGQTGGVSATGGMGGMGGMGGSTGPGISIPDGGNDGPCSAVITCAGKGYNCGTVGDGCGGTLDCGTCTKPGESCGGAGMPNVCGAPPCMKKTCAGLGYDCGMASDGCNGTLDCGMCSPGQTCGSGGTNKCGMTICTPKDCATQGFDCGMQGDTCGNVLNCGTCTGNQTCGGGGTPGKCGIPPCMPKTCAQQGFNCGMATDGCNHVIDCGTCMGGDVCGGNMANVCSSTCTGLCLKQVACPGNGTTSVSGTVFAPQGIDPLYSTLVYVPNAPVLPFTPGVSCGKCGKDVSGSPLVSAVTGVDGTFKITNMPVGQNIPLVIQNGRWRRQFVIPNVAACVDTPLPTSGPGQIRMPQTQAEGDIPLMGFVTGSVDALECVLRKIGIADSEFSDPSGTGRVRFYVGGDSAGGATYSASTPPEDQLWGTQAEINKYDMVYFACKGAQYDRTPLAQQIVVNYANAGGRIFGTHYSYVWLYNATPFSTTAIWNVNALTGFSADPGDGVITQTFPKGQALAQWLVVVGASITLGHMPIQNLRHDFDGVIAPSLLWINDADPSLGNVPMHYTFDTPVGAAPANQCGRVLYDDFHVENVASFGTFPLECPGGAMTPQEKMLEFMIFDLGSCVAPPVCVPKTCAQLNVACGPASDTCGNIIQCGMCPSGQSCGGGGTPGKCGAPPCVPLTCAQQGFNCGQQGDGCGNIINCGSCPSGNCGGGGTPGVCGNGTCVPTTCMAQNVMCGSVGDGCGNIIDCGTCPAGKTCGGGGVPGMCGAPPCMPKSCVQQGFNCGAASDGCNNIIQCGTCMLPQVCGGGSPGKANVCGGGGGA
jgi:hypothetical protein